MHRDAASDAVYPGGAMNSRRFRLHEKQDGSEAPSYRLGDGAAHARSPFWTEIGS